MNMKKLLLTTATTALMLSPAYGAIKLDEIVVKGPTWNPTDSGKNSYDKAKINQFITPNQDLNDLFRTMPNVQFNTDYKKALRSSSDTSSSNKVTQRHYSNQVLDQRPQGISISGGKFYENLFRVNGRDATTRLPFNGEEVGITGGTAYHTNRGAGWKNRSSNSEWIKPFDIESVDIYDSNVPAKFGKFSGGVVDVKTKKPKGGDKHSGNFYYDFSGDKWEETKYIGDVDRVDEKWNAYSIGGRFNTKTYDLGDSKQVAFMVSQNRSKRTTKNPLSAEQLKSPIKFAPDTAQSISKDQTVSAKVSLRHDTTVNVSMGNSKYDIDNVHGESVFIYDTQQRQGENMSLSVDKKLSGGRTVNVTFDTTENKLNRDGFGKWDAYVFGGDVGITDAARQKNCGNTTGCTQGGYGDAFERENNRNIRLTYGMPSKWGRLEFGGALQNATLRFKRNQDSTEYNSEYWKYVNGNHIFDGASIASKAVCEKQDATCQTRNYVFTKRTTYHKKDVKVSGTEKNAHMQLTRKLDNGLTMRAGIRYDYDTLLKNNVFAPRLSLSHNIVGYGGEWPTTYGLNRYYANSNATYYLYSEQVNGSTTEYRKFTNTMSGSTLVQTLWKDEWHHKSYTGGNKYGIKYKLKTPHKDELSVATQTPNFGIGQFRTKIIYRKGQNEFAQSAKSTDHWLTNDGWSRYRALNLEYRKTWGANSFFANTTFSSNKANTRSLLQKTDDQNLVGLVLYKGREAKKMEVMKKADDYNKPQVYNFGYSRNFNINGWGNIMAGITGRYTQSYTRVGPTYHNNGRNVDSIKSNKDYMRTGENWVTFPARYDSKVSNGCSKTRGYDSGGWYYENECEVYDDIKYASRLDLNGRLTWDIQHKGDPTGVQVYTGINNLLNTRYKGGRDGRTHKGLFRGRSFTFGTQVSF